jgi:hypothetical protein
VCVCVIGIDRRPTRMSECVGDMHAYARLGEYLFKMIEHSFEPVSDWPSGRLFLMSLKFLMCVVSNVWCPVS